MPSKIPPNILSRFGSTIWKYRIRKSEHNLTFIRFILSSEFSKEIENYTWNFSWTFSIKKSFLIKFTLIRASKIMLSNQFRINNKTGDIFKLLVDNNSIYNFNKLINNHAVWILDLFYILFLHHTRRPSNRFGDLRTTCRVLDTPPCFSTHSPIPFGLYTYERRLYEFLSRADLSPFVCRVRRINQVSLHNDFITEMAFSVDVK